MTIFTAAIDTDLKLEMQMQIKDTTAFVTGANRGIGRAIINSLLQQGAAKVYATARDQVGLDAIAKIGDARITPVRLDITDPAQATQAASQADDVKLLINNAGSLTLGPILQATPEDLRANMETNYFGTLNVTRAFAPVIAKIGGGAIVNQLSIVALASMPGLAAYNASKAAAWSMTQSIRADLSAQNIAVHGVYPGPVDTDMTRVFDVPKASPESVAQAILAGVQAGVEDIFPDDVSRGAYEAWCQDHKAVEAQFAQM